MTHRVAMVAVLIGAGALAVYACELYTRPEPYTPPPLVLQGTEPIHDPEDAGHDR